MGRFFAQQVGNNQQHRDKEQRAGDTRNQQGRVMPLSAAATTTGAEIGAYSSV